MSPGRKVQPGEPLRVSAKQYNRFIDAADANEKLRLPVAGGLAGGTPVIQCYNASGMAAPWRGVVEISDGAVTGEQVEFVQPGQATGVGLYGILLQPIHAAGVGLVAVAGGPWMLASGAAAGATVGPRDGFWTASSSGTTWEVLRGAVDDAALVRFASTGFASLVVPDYDAVLFYNATTKLLEWIPTAEDCTYPY